VADYVILLTRLCDIIFQWWSYICNSHQNLSWTRLFLLFVESTTPDLNVMEWSNPCPHYVRCVTKLTLMDSPHALSNIMGKGFTISIVLIWSCLKNPCTCTLEDKSILKLALAEWQNKKYTASYLHFEKQKWHQNSWI
jgi:hypothetical protein